MALSFTGQAQSFELINPGRYDVTLKAEFKQKKDGDQYINCSFTIDPLQEFAGRVVFDAIYKTKASNYQEYSASKINGILSTIPVVTDAEGKVVSGPKLDFEDYDELVQYFNGLKMNIEVQKETTDATNPNAPMKNTVKFLSYLPYQGVAEKAEEEAKKPINQEELPF